MITFWVNKNTKISSDDVIYFKSDPPYSRAYHTNGHSYLVNASLNEVVSVLNTFVRIRHNLAVKKIMVWRYSGNCKKPVVILKNGIVLPVGRTYVKDMWCWKKRKRKFSPALTPYERIDITNEILQG